jgi:hypothetical protein
VPFNVFSVGGAEAEAALHAAGQQPLHQVLEQRRHILKNQFPRIRIRRFLGLPDLHLDPLVTSTDSNADPAPDPSLFS